MCAEAEREDYGLDKFGSHEKIAVTSEHRIDLGVQDRRGCMPTKVKERPKVTRPDEEKIRESVGQDARRLLKPFLNRVKAQRNAKVTDKVKFH